MIKKLILKKKKEIVENERDNLLLEYNQSNKELKRTKKNYMKLKKS